MYALTLFFEALYDFKTIPNNRKNISKLFFNRSLHGGLFWGQIHFVNL